MLASWLQEEFLGGRKLEEPRAVGEESSGEAFIASVGLSVLLVLLVKHLLLSVSLKQRGQHTEPSV